MTMHRAAWTAWTAGASMAGRAAGAIRAAAATSVLAWLVGTSGTATAAPAPQHLEGVVERVVDGDSLWLRAGDAAPLEVRLQGIDAPEGCQAGGPAARDMLAGFVLDKPVTALVRGRDHYGRTLATIEVDGLNVNQRMVAEGHAWSIRTRWDRGPYVAQERLAKALRRGLHAEGGAELPADFRRRHGPCEGAPAARREAAPAAGAGPAGPPADGTAATRAGSELVIGGAPRRPAAPAASGWRCDGRTQCAQMRSCEEATWFLQNCPGVKMDGNRDGVPCERQWCGR